MYHTINQNSYKTKTKQNKQADHWSVPRPVNKIPRVLITPMRAWWANDQNVLHLQAKTLPKNLICGESAQWFLSSSVRKIPGALIMPMGMPIWANDQDIAHLQAEKVPMNLIGSESAQWLLSYGVRKVWAGRTAGRLDKRTDGGHSIVPLFLLRKGRGTKICAHLMGYPMIETFLHNTHWSEVISWVGWNL